MTRPPSPFARALTALGSLCLLVGGWLLLARAVPRLQWWLPGVGANSYSVMMSSFISYGVFAWLGALGCFLLALIVSRKRLALGIASLVSTIGLIVQASWLAPYFIADNRPARSDSVVVAALNAYDGPTDAAAMMTAFARVDIAVVVELSRQGLADLNELGWGEQFPYSYGSDTSSAIFSRFPIESGRMIALSFPQAIAQVSVPELGTINVVAAHPCNTFCGVDTWLREGRRLQSAASELDGPIIIAGDFNSVDDHVPMLNLRAAGLRCTADHAGSGLAPTWPTNLALWPVFAIDHILLTDELIATESTLFDVRESDHLGVRARVARASSKP